MSAMQTSPPVEFQQLRGQTVVVTGAGRGFGEGIARRMAQHGAQVIATALEADELDGVATTIAAEGGKVATYAVDLGNPAQLDEFAAAVLATFGRVDALVNNAALLRMKSFTAMSAAEFDETIAVNLLAPVRLSRAFLPAMLEASGGAIINVSSAAGIRPFVDETDYCAAKYGLEGFSYSLAMELQSANISVNLISPGYRIKPTSVTAAEFAAWPEERRAEFRDPIDMADAFVFLALQDGSGVTGQRFNAWELTERVHRDGWDWPARDAQEAGASSPGGTTA
jgi:NAD(P)-dependent dehydrogenase (short-subunit alcohol dehydrogenase family)